jgi:hypothetical protein
MNKALRGIGIGLLAAGALLLSGGCPGSGQDVEFVSGGGSDAGRLVTNPTVQVFTPASDLSIQGGTQVELNWLAQPSSRFASVTLIIDPDTEPENGNETIVASNLAVDQTRRLINTTSLLQGSYNLGVLLFQLDELVASAYAPGQITIDQRPSLVFSSPLDNFDFDRTEAINPSFTVAWEVTDPDSTNDVTIFLDPDESPNGNEIVLYRSTAQDADSFTFDLPTSAFEAGTYRLLAVVSDGQNATAFYVPGSIRLRARLAGFVDLRDIGLPESSVSGAIFEGFNPRDNAGSFVSECGDIDGDGFDEFMIVSQFGKPRLSTNIQRTGIGEAYLIWGRQNRFRGVNNLNSTGTLFRGDIFTGVPEAPDAIRPTRGITSFTVLSDWDGGGVRELAFGVPFTDSIIANNFVTNVTEGIGIDNDGAFRTGGVVIGNGESLRPSLGFPGGFVYNLAGYGQVERGTDSLTAPCPEGFYGPNSPPAPGGATYYYRHFIPSGPTDLELNQPGARILTHDFGDQTGETIASYPFTGLLISVPNRDPVVNTSVGESLPGAGVVSLYLGGYIWELGNNFLPHNGPYRYILDDVRVFPTIVGPRTASPGYWVDPDDSPNPCATFISTITPIPARTVRVYGNFPGAAVGNVASVGDFSADGVADFLVGSPLSDSGRGACFIVLGRLPALALNGELNLAELGLPMSSADPQQQRVFDGIRVIGEPGERLGISQAEAGDFNNDGIPDVLIGSPLSNNRRGGAAVFFGSRTVINLTQAEIPYRELAARGLGVIFEGELEGDLAGARVANAGDVDGDGNGDILIAAPNRSVRLDQNFDGEPEIDRARCGVVYLVYGSPDLQGVISLADIGTEKLPGVAFIGREADHFLGAGLGEQGDRSRGIDSAGDVDGDGRGDVLIGSVHADPRDRANAGETYLIYGVGD